MVPMKDNRNTHARCISLTLLITLLLFGMNSAVNAQKLLATGAGLFNQSPSPNYEKPIYDDNQPSSNGSVHALIEYKGELYAAGNFKMAGNITAPNIARWNGSAWAAVGTGIDGYVSALCVFNNELYVSGEFKLAGGLAVKNIAKWNGSTWAAAGEIATYEVNALAVYKGELYAAGSFAEEEAIQANLFKWNGKNWQPIKTKHDNDIFALAVYHDELYAGGTFLKGNNARVMKWNGKTWADAGVQLNGAVSCFTINNDKLFAGGYFSLLNNTPAPFIVNFDGRHWNYTAKGLGGTVPHHWMSSLATFAGNVYAGGQFTTEEGAKLAKNLSVLKPEGWSPVIYNLEGSVLTMAVYKNALYIGGSFSFVDGTQVSQNIGRIE